MKFFVLYILFFLHLITQAQTVSINIDWSNLVRSIPDYAYGVNSSANFIPSYSNDVLFMGNLDRITQKKGFVRLHGWGMLGGSPESWQTNGVWDTVKINQALSPLVAQGYKVMINIPSGFNGEEDYQDAQAFAQFCADLVQIVNIDNQFGIEYWEIPNEREQGFAVPGLSVNRMASFINTASLAMKAVDPTIKVGGSATAWVNVDYLTQLTQATFPNIDFITCHTYSGDCTNSLENAYDIAQFAVSDLALLRQNINTITNGSYLPIFLTEYNISYQGCANIQSNNGAVYDAIIMTESIKSGIDATCYWNVAPYSDMSVMDGNQLDGNAYLYEIFNTSFYGNLVESNSSENSKVLVYATINQSANSYSFCLINRTALLQSVQLQMEELLPINLERHLWDAQNDYFTESTNWSNLNDGTINLSPYSVNLFVGELNTLNVIDIEDNDNTILFPNPNNGMIYISNRDNINKIQIFSHSSVLVKSENGENDYLDIKDLSLGVYFVKMTYKTGKVTITKMIKN